LLRNLDPRPGKKINPKNFLPNFKYLSPAAQANVKELADRGIGVRTGAFTMNQLENVDLTSNKKTYFNEKMYLCEDTDFVFRFL